MRIGFTDPQGLKRWRVAPYLLPLLAFLAVFLPIESDVYGASMLFFSALLFNLVGMIPWQQQTPRNAELECGAGYIEIKKAGTRNQRIHAKDITGGTSARTKKGFVFTMQLRGRNQPVTLELASEEELTRVRHALGIGHGGFGTVAWATQSDSNSRTSFVGRFMAAGSSALMMLCLLGMDNRDAAIGLCSMLGILGAIGGLIGFFGLFSRPPDPTVVMAWDGLKLKSVGGWFALPYNMLAQVDDTANHVVFRLPPPHHPVAVERSSPLMGGLSDADRKVLTAQVSSAAQRARGLGPQKDDVRGRIEQLRRKGESPRDWLVRLDMAGQTLASGAGYRGHTLDPEDLWAILEDPEAEAELRAAAARVLRHSPKPEARVRIDAAVAAVRDDATKSRLRIATRDDLDGASQELAFLDATERTNAPQHQHVMYPPTYSR
ncbi:MAG: hypothetical protein KIT84_28810 [Labilithrix sp.]|nr:hypothetical protein [Labilithrix sp.]MCW5815062.1 hypothetical protein [Labilithrix sp.]